MKAPVIEVPVDAAEGERLARARRDAQAKVDRLRHIADGPAELEAPVASARAEVEQARAEVRALEEHRRPSGGVPDAVRDLQAAKSTALASVLEAAEHRLALAEGELAEVAARSDPRERARAKRELPRAVEALEDAMLALDVHEAAVAGARQQWLREVAEPQALAEYLRAFERFWEALQPALDRFDEMVRLRASWHRRGVRNLPGEELELNELRRTDPEMGGRQHSAVDWVVAQARKFGARV
jgi:hypothetical protein